MLSDAILHHHNLKTSSLVLQRLELAKDDIMPIPISENLQQWLVSKNLQGYINIAKVEPHPNVVELLQQIDI